MNENPTKGHVLVVDDHAEMIDLLASRLHDCGWSVETADSGPKGLERLKESLPDVLVTDLRMERVDGFDLLDEALNRDEELPVIIMTAFGDIESAVDATKRGAYHYMTKPFEFEELRVYLDRALDTRKLRRENRAYRRMVADRDALDRIVGSSDAMASLKRAIKQAATTDAPALVYGESGTGKELVARAIHASSYRSAEPFVPVNCAVLPENLLESELFGHTKGAFTGADTARSGLFVEADGGSILLDEIGDMPAPLQAKLLRTLEERTVRPVGADRPEHIDVRVVAATHHDLDERVREGEFREDLFYRLNVIPIEVPPLRDRRKDIPMLVEHFLQDARSRDADAEERRFAPELIDALQSREWPGNVRQLKNIVERLFVMNDSEVVTLEDLERVAPDDGARRQRWPAQPDQLQPLDSVTDEYIRWVIERCDGNKSRAAEILEIDTSTIYRRLEG